MPICRTLRNYLAVTTLVLIGSAGRCGAQAGAAYAEPDFELSLFVREALLLETQEIAAAARALAALASNFPSSGEIDHELRAKALAIALRLDGTFPPAVAANAKLRGGEQPAPLDDFKSLPEIAATLWSTAGFLESPEKGKDERILQFCLVDIARAIDPTNLEESNRYPTRLPSSVFEGWGAILRKGKQPGFEFPPDEGDPEKVVNPDPPPDVPRPAPPAVGASPRKAQGSLRSIAAADGDGSPPIATIAGDLTAGGGTEPHAIVFADGEGATSQPLNSFRETLVSALTELQGGWPNDGGVLVLTVNSTDPADQALLLPAALLADSLIRQAGLDPDVVALGSVAPEGSLMAVDSLFQRLQRLRQQDAKVIILPEENLPDLHDMLLLGDLAPFFRHQLLFASTLKEASAIASATRDEKLESSLAEFRTIQEVAKDRDLKELAGFSALSKNLNKVTALNPRHASAALLLQFAAGELPPHLTRKGSLAALYRATAPVVAAMQEQGNADRATAAGALEAVVNAQPVLDPTTAGLSGRMVGLLKDIGSYADLPSKTSAAATALKTKIFTDWEAVRGEYGRLKDGGDE